MVDIIHRVGIKAPVSQVYAVLSTIEGVAGWWTREATGRSKPGGTIEFSFSTPAGERIGGFGMEVMALEPEKKVHWRVRSGPDEWIGTDVVFQLGREGAEFAAHCTTKWATFLLSLRDLVATGKGRPAPDDLQIGNWH